MSDSYNTIDYYTYYILSLTIVYILTSFGSNFIHNKYKKKDKLNLTFDYYGMKDHIQIIHDELTPEQSSLRIKYLVASLLVKAATWVKAPYLFALYNRVHGFSRAEIGVLYAIDNITSFVLGPIVGSLCDIFGRKKFCVIYSALVMAHITLRITGNRELAVFAQILTGICSIILETSYESWVNFEAGLLFSIDDDGNRQKNAFLREVFSKQITVDCFSSIVLTGVATFLYMTYDIFYPFYLCIFFSFLSGLYISLTWQENNLELIEKYSHEPTKIGFFQLIRISYEIIFSDKALLSVGIIESSFKISLVLFSFMWTPLLEETTNSRIHPGAIFVCFMLARLIGSELFEGSKKLLKTNTYVLSIIVTVTGAVSFFLEYYIRNFQLRLIMLVYFDGLSGIFMPLMSSLKSQMIPENSRSTIMSFFRLPINFFCICILLLSAYISTYQICFVAFGFMVFASIVNVLLFIWHSPPDAERRIIKMTTRIKSSMKLVVTKLED